MTITRINEFHAIAGQGDALRERLRELLPTIRSAPGCVSCELLQALDEPARLLIVERWDDVESHQRALKAAPKHAFERTAPLLDRPPTGAYFKE
jgi:quinol monooxygenase YgiN